MNKELIERLRVFAGDPVLGSVADEAADALEVQQSWLRVKDATIGQMANGMAAAQKRIDELETQVDQLQWENKGIAEWREIALAAQAQIKVLREALENCRLFAARRRAEEWATHILRLCESGGSVANPLRQDDSALRELLKAEREKCAKVIERLISGDGVCADDGVWIHDCAEAIRAMEDQ